MGSSDIFRGWIDEDNRVFQIHAESIMKKAIIILPTYNERENIRELIPAIFDETKDMVGWVIEILVVDDHSPDGTFDVVQELQKKHSRLHGIQGKKEGLGKAYLRGFQHALDTFKPDVLFEMDADGQHPVNLIPLFLKSIDKGADFVIGSRYIPGGSIPQHWSIDRKFYSSVGSIVARLGFMNFSVKDWTSGFRALRSSFVQSVIPEMEGHTGYVFQIALLDKAIKKNLKVKEIPLKFVDRIDGVSKMQSVQFMFDALMYIFLNSSFVKFFITGGLGFVIDFGISKYLIDGFHIFAPLATGISAEIAIIFNFFVNNFWSFAHKKVDSSFLTYARKLIKFNLVSSGSIFIQTFGLYLALMIFGHNPYSILSFSVQAWAVYKVIIIMCIIIPYSYILYNKVVWKEPKTS